MANHSTSPEARYGSKDDFELAPCEDFAWHSTWKIDRVVPSIVEAISPFVDDVMGSLTENCCPPAEKFAVEMALCEAITNAVVHGNRLDPRKKVRVCCACDSKRGIVIVVRDQGNGFDSSKMPSPLSGKQIQSDHGRGIYLIHLLMDEVQFREGGRDIYIRKDFHQPR